MLYCATLGLIFLWTLEKPIDIVTPAALIGGVFTCGLWCLAMLWADGRFLPRPLQMPWLLWLLVADVGRGAHAAWGAKGFGTMRPDFLRSRTELLQFDPLDDLHALVRRPLYRSWISAGQSIRL